MISRIYLGYRAADNTREIFRAPSEPTFATHGDRYNAVVGPFRTLRGATFMRDHGEGNPHCRCVGDAEHIAAGQVYDIALGKWVRR